MKTPRQLHSTFSFPSSLAVCLRRTNPSAVLSGLFYKVYQQVKNRVLFSARAIIAWLALSSGNLTSLSHFLLPLVDLIGGYTSRWKKKTEPSKSRKILRVPDESCSNAQTRILNESPPPQLHLLRTFLPEATTTPALTARTSKYLSRPLPPAYF